MRVRDSQRRKVGSAIWSIPKGRSFATMREADQWVAKITDTSWFRRQFGTWLLRGMPRSYWKCERDVLYMLAWYGVRDREPGVIDTKWAWARGALHGPEMAHALLVLVQHYLGIEAAKALRAAYRTNRVRYRPKRQLSEATKTALRDRLAVSRLLSNQLAGNALPPMWDA